MIHCCRSDMTEKPPPDRRFHVLQFTLIAKTCQTAQDHENVTENRLDPNIKMNGVNEVRTYKGKGARVKNERMKNEE